MGISIIGLDLSLTGTGICVYYIPADASDLKPCIETNRLENDLTGPERLIFIREKVVESCRGAELVCLENYAFGRPNQAHQVGELGGVVRVALHEAGIKYVEVTPNQLKKFATGKGGAKKEEVMLGVYKKWQKEFPSNDETDAFVLAKIGETLVNGMGEDLSWYRDNGYTVPQIEVLAELRGEKKAAKKKKGKAGDKEPQKPKKSKKKGDVQP